MSSTSAAVFHSQASQALGCKQVARLFSPLACHTFTDVYFERLHLLSRATGMEHLLRSEELPGLASHWQFKIAEDHAQARILLPDSFMHDDAYKPGALLDGPALTRAVQANRTVVLHNVELYSRRIGLLALGACTSDPGPKRVAQDIIKAESLANPDLDEECLLERLDAYSNDQLVSISEGLVKENSADQAIAEEDLAKFKADLETCT